MNAKAIRLRLPDGIDRDLFLRDYWQRRPLLMRNALPVDAFPLSADELAGLACEEEIESRLIVEHPQDGWQLRHGPFDETDFAALPPTHWTLLVQDVDKFLPEVARLITTFRFLPAWRIDDIMISYASDQGGVGPHSDAYDVFLMQAGGRRRWRISYADYGEQDLIPGLDQRILSHFDTDEDWLLEPGDVLYLPPGVAHWGTADGECMTYSLGFRQPSQRELLGDWFQQLVDLADDSRSKDPDRLQADNPAELTDAVFAAARSLLDALPASDSATFRHWYGGYMTETKPQFQLLPADHPWSLQDLISYIADDNALIRDPAARMAWSQVEPGAVTLYCQGQMHSLPAELRDAVRQLAENRWLDTSLLKQLEAAGEPLRALLLTLVNEGVLHRDDGP